MPKTFRVTVVFDFEVDDDKDPDEFHDELRDWLEDDTFLNDLWALESIREIDVKELTD